MSPRGSFEIRSSPRRGPCLWKGETPTQENTGLEGKLEEKETNSSGAVRVRGGRGRTLSAPALVYRKARVRKKENTRPPLNSSAECSKDKERGKGGSCVSAARSLKEKMGAPKGGHIRKRSPSRVTLMNQGDRWRSVGRREVLKGKTQVLPVREAAPGKH